MCCEDEYNEDKFDEDETEYSERGLFHQIDVGRDDLFSFVAEKTGIERQTTSTFEEEMGLNELSLIFVGNRYMLALFSYLTVVRSMAV